MSGTLNDQLNQIADTKSAIADAITSKGIQVSENDPFATYATKIKQIQGGEGGNAFNLFDIKVCDHKLEGTEALGWVEQGTKIYKSEYPSFYEKCLEEYNNSALSKQYYALSSSITINGSNLKEERGILSGFTGVGADWAKTSYTIPSTITSFELVGRVTYPMTMSSSGTLYGQISSNNANPQMTLSSRTGMAVYVSSTGSSWDVLSTSVDLDWAGKTYYVKLAWDGNKYTCSYSSDNINWITGIEVESDKAPYWRECHLIGSEQSTKTNIMSPGVKLHLNDMYIKINDNIVWEATEKIDVQKYENGHLYYDASSIEVLQKIDTLYRSYKDMDWYGINVEEESIILPRPINEEDKYIYYCVGNTVKDESIIDISKEIELNNPFFLGQSQYFETEPNNLSWLKSGGSYHTKEMYPSMYEYILENVQAGKKDFVDVNGEYDYYCYVLDQSTETFRLPLLDGSESIIDWDAPIMGLSSNTTITIPYNGALIYSINENYANEGATGFNITINGKDYMFHQGYTGSDYMHPTNGFLQLKKGDVIKIPSSEGQKIQFVKYTGNGSLYFYAGETVQNANLINAGKIQTQLTNKLDTRLGNLPQESKSYLSSIGMPSEEYVDLTLGSNGSTYTAPANGWVAFGKTTGGAGQYIAIRCPETNIGFLAQGYKSGNNIRVYLPIKAGHNFVVNYDASGSTLVFRFIYAEGEQ